MTAAALIGLATTVIAPNRITQIKVTGISGRADHRAAPRVSGRSQTGDFRRRHQRLPTGRVQRRTTGSAIAVKVFQPTRERKRTNPEATVLCDCTAPSLSKKTHCLGPSSGPQEDGSIAY